MRPLSTTTVWLTKQAMKGFDFEIAAENTNLDFDTADERIVFGVSKPSLLNVELESGSSEQEPLFP